MINLLSRTDHFFKTYFVLATSVILIAVVIFGLVRFVKGKPSPSRAAGIWLCAVGSLLGIISNQASMLSFWRPAGHQECQRSMRKMMLGTLVYADANDDTLPNSSDWSTDVARAITLGSCTEAPKGRGIGFNRALAVKKMSSVEVPQRRVAFGDVVDVSTKDPLFQNSSDLEIRHPMGLSVATVDGGSRLVSPAEYALPRLKIRDDSDLEIDDCTDGRDRIADQFDRKYTNAIADVANTVCLGAMASLIFCGVGLVLAPRIAEDRRWGWWCLLAFGCGVFWGGVLLETVLP